MQAESRPKTCALIGNPNSGKSSLFNELTGLRQDVSNFPGVTVDKKTAIVHLADTTLVRLIDFPGAYSLFPNSIEERIVVESICQPNGPFVPDLVVYVADVTQLERHLLLATQIIDLGFPLIFVVNMMDILEDEGSKFSVNELERFLQVPIVPVSVRKNVGIETLKLAIYGALYDVPKKRQKIYNFDNTEQIVSSKVAETLKMNDLVQAKLIAHHHSWLSFLEEDQRNKIQKIVSDESFVDLRYQVQETMSRFDAIVPIVKKTISSNAPQTTTITDKIDDVITHRFWGPTIFLSIMLLVFQAIFTWASLPMDFIESAFATGGTWFRSWMPSTWMTDLFIEGIWAGLGGVLVFVPQIAILFFLVSILEESGYMSRAVYMFDNIMRKFGLNGRSMVALISSAACAIPAIMSTRTISNQKERLLTILVSPLISCSARLPVYAVLVGFAVPVSKVGGIFNSQGLAFMGLYLLGIVGALVSALMLKPFIKDVSGSHLMMELPNYKAPLWKNIGVTVVEKVKSFIVDAGKIILLISIGLWALGSYGPKEAMSKVDENAKSLKASQPHLDDEKALATAKLEASYIGHFGKAIEPAIAPLGFDWKIGIAIITSFAAREVFVGTMATIYSVGDADSELPLRQRMAAEKRADGSLVYTAATAMSLLVFYVFAMQCMSTLAVTKRETHSWKWPIVQFVFMSILAYVSSFLVYQLMS